MPKQTLTVPCSVRVVKEEGRDITEIFVKSNAPALNFSLQLPGNVDVKSGQYDMTFSERAAEPTKPAPFPAPAQPAS